MRGAPGLQQAVLTPAASGKGSGLLTEDEVRICGVAVASGGIAPMLAKVDQARLEFRLRLAEIGPRLASIGKLNQFRPNLAYIQRGKLSAEGLTPPCGHRRPQASEQPQMSS